MIQQLAVIGCNATISPQLVEIQTPLIQFVWTCCGFAVDASICCGFVVQLVVQQIHNKLYKLTETGLNALAEVDTTSRCVLPRPCLF